MKIGDLVRVRAHTRWSVDELTQDDRQSALEDAVKWGLGIIIDLYALDSASAAGPHFKVQFEAEHCWFEDFELEVISES